MAKVWMVRAGQNAYLIDEFKKGKLSLGWHEAGSLENLQTPEQILRAYQRAFPSETKAQVSIAVAMLHKFRSVMKKGTKS
jgi:restriction system protein